MSDAPQGPGWWQASDGRWYPPAATPAPPPSSSGTPAPPPAGTPAPPSLAKGTPAPGADPTQAFPPAGGYAPSPGTPAPPLGTPAPPAGGYGPPTGPYGPTTVPPGGYGPPTVPPPAGPAKKGSGAGLYVVLALIAFVAVAGTAVFFIVSGGDDDPGPTTTEEPTVTENLTLVAATDVGPDAFGTAAGAAFQSEDLPGLSTAARDAAGDVRSSLSAGPAGALVATGSTERLFGGSRTDQVCDALAVADFLEGDGERGTAFAGVLGVGAADLRSYLGGLTPVVLVNDTWVTDHGFADGQATATSAVLQAGTAVLVDGVGVPRVRCVSADPLTAPSRDGRSPAATEGSEWDGYDAEQVVVVEPGDELQTLAVIDVETGEEFSRAVGAGRTGEVQVSLQWSSAADLDLHVFDPEGFEIYFASRESDSGGELDVDVIPGCSSSEELHTENVFWPADEAPSGTYRVVVDNYNSCDAPSQEFELRVIVDGEVVLSETATVDEDEETSEYTFDV